MTSLRSLKHSDGTLNVLDFGLHNDGVTYNDQPFVNFRLALKSYGRGPIFSGVTITPGSPVTSAATFTFTAHGLGEGDALVFSTTGTLPSPIVAGQVYYVLSKAKGIAGGPGILTADTFQISSTNVSLYFFGPTPGVAPVQTPIAVTSGGTGTHSFQLSGTEKVRVLFPPGLYKFGDPNVSGNDILSFSCGGVRNLDVTANGAHFNDFGPGDFGAFTQYAGAGEGGGQLWAYMQSYTNLSQNFVNLITPAEAYKFTIGGWVKVMGVECQANFGGYGQGGPTGDPNNNVCEYVKVTGISGGTLYLERPLRRCYLSTWPIFYSGVDPTTPGINTFTEGGAACLVPMHPGWDTKRIYRGIHSTAGGQNPVVLREAMFEDCLFDGRGVYPGNSGRIEFYRCSWFTDMEVDKCNEFVGFYNCYIPCTISMQSSSTNDTVFHGSYVKSLGGTDKNVTIDHCRIDNLAVGPLGTGFTESLTITNSSIGGLSLGGYFWGPASSLWMSKLSAGLINNYTFNDGVLSQPMMSLSGHSPTLIPTGANAWAVPGGHMYFADYAGRWDNMGNPFKVTDIFMTPPESAAVNVTLAGNGSPVGTGTPVDAVVTWSAANNGDIIFFTGPKFGWPYTPNFSVQPWVIIPYYPFIVVQKGNVSAGLTANQFKLALPSDATLTPVQLTGPTSTVQALLNPVFNIQTTLKTIPTGNSRNISGAQISIANPTVITWGPGAGSPHGLVLDDVVVFKTTDTLPGSVVSGIPQGIVAGQPYYVMSAGLTANTFQVSWSPSNQGTPAQSTLGYTQAGTHTAISNPIQFGRHPCVRLTAIGNYGGYPTDWYNSITSMEGAYNEPMYSRCKGIIGGFSPLDIPGYMPRYYVWGNVKLITINVIQPWTGTGTCIMKLTSSVFDPSLNRSVDIQSIDCTVPGIRTISRTGVTGTAAAAGGNPGDTIAAITKWLSGAVSPTFTLSTGGGGTAAFPLIEIEFLTDQGVSKINNMVYHDSHTGYGHAYVMTGTYMLNRAS